MLHGDMRVINLKHFGWHSQAYEHGRFVWRRMRCPSNAKARYRKTYDTTHWLPLRAHSGSFISFPSKTTTRKWVMRSGKRNIARLMRNWMRPALIFSRCQIKISRGKLALIFSTKNENMRSNNWNIYEVIQCHVCVRWRVIQFVLIN